MGEATRAGKTGGCAGSPACSLLYALRCFLRRGGEVAMRVRVIRHRLMLQLHLRLRVKLLLLQIQQPQQLQQQQQHHVDDEPVSAGSSGKGL